MNLTLQQHLHALPQDTLIQLKESITIAGLMHSNGKSTKKYFRGLAKESSGKLKKIYISMAKGSHKNLDDVFNRSINDLQ